VEELAYGRMVGEIGAAQAAGQVAPAIPAAHVDSVREAVERLTATAG
jgi:hypothetical protein